LFICFFIFLLSVLVDLIRNHSLPALMDLDVFNRLPARLVQFCQCFYYRAGTDPGENHQGAAARRSMYGKRLQRLPVMAVCARVDGFGPRGQEPAPRQ